MVNQVERVLGMDEPRLRELGIWLRSGDVVLRTWPDEYQDHLRKLYFTRIGTQVMVPRYLSSPVEEQLQMEIDAEIESLLSLQNKLEEVVLRRFLTNGEHHMVFYPSRIDVDEAPVQAAHAKFGVSTTIENENVVLVLMHPRRWMAWRNEEGAELWR